MWPIVGSEEIAAGRLTRGALRWNYTAVHPNVYLPNGAPLTMSARAHAAWLWSGREAIIAGRAAAYLHGVYWVADSAPIELIGRHRRPTRGVVIRDERIGDDEARGHDGRYVTTAARTAFDLARHLPRNEAVAILDALSARSGVTAVEVHAVADRYPGARGLPAARLAVDLMDGGAQSREETALRLYLVDSIGLPRPTTNITIGDKYGSARIAMGWEWAKVGVSWDKPAATDDGYPAVQRIREEEVVQRLGWLHIRAHPRRALHSVRFQAQTALRSRGR